MIHPQRMHSKDNHEVSPEEKVSMATLVKMSKMLKLERGDHKYYPPQRLVIKGYRHVPVDNEYLDYIINAPIKFIQLLHPTRTMVQAEYVNMDENDNQPFHFTISLPDIPSSRDWEDDFGGYDSGEDDSSNPITATSSSVVWAGLSTKNDASFYTFAPYRTPVNTLDVGFPITDTQYLNNNSIRIQVKSRDKVTLARSVLDLTLVFYTYTGYDD
jgi:hypothetical protein